MINKKVKEVNILFVLNNSALNRGMNTGLENLAWGLAEKGLDIYILSGGRRPTTHSYRLPSNITYYFSDKSGDNPYNFLEVFKKIIKKHRIDIVIGWIINIAPLSQTDKNYEISFIGNQGQIAPKSLIINLMKKVVKKKITLLNLIRLLKDIYMMPGKIRRIVSISNTVQDSCIHTYKLDKQKCTIIPRGIDTNIYRKKQAISKEKNTILYAGNIQPSKGIDDLINSLKSVNTPVKVTLCGRGDLNYIKYIQEKVNEYNKEHELNFTGPLNQVNLVDYYNSCDIFVFPSHSEGLGKALLEAMSCGCPVICSDIPTFKEIIKNKHNGLMVPVKSPNDLAQAINYYLNNPNIKEYYGENARLTVEEKFSKKSEVGQWIKLLKKVV